MDIHKYEGFHLLTPHHAALVHADCNRLSSFACGAVTHQGLQLPSICFHYMASLSCCVLFVLRFGLCLGCYYYPYYYHHCYYY